MIGYTGRIGGIAFAISAQARPLYGIAFSIGSRRRAAAYAEDEAKARARRQDRCGCGKADEAQGGQW